MSDSLETNEGMREGCHVRVGWGRREAPLNGPVGLDGYSYGYRDKTGEKVTLSRPRPYGATFRSTDVIGMYISLPPTRVANPKDPSDPAHLNRERIAIDFKGQEMFEMQEYPQSKEMIALMDYSGKSSHSASLPPTSTKKGTGGKLPERTGASTSTVQNKNADLRPLPTLPGSRVAFFVNGQCQGDAFQDIYDFLQLRQTDKKAKEKKRYREGLKESHKDNPFDDGTLGYYPFISLFNDASVQINPGPDFDFPPPPDIEAILENPNAITPDDDTQTRTWRPICERYPEFMSEQWAFDEREEQEAESQMAENAVQEKAAAQKKAQREKKRRETEAKKKAKMQTKEKSPSVGPGLYSLPVQQPQPSPLRQASITLHGNDAVADTDPEADLPSSPAPMFIGNGSGNALTLQTSNGPENGDEEVRNMYSAVDFSTQAKIEEDIYQEQYHPSIA